MYRRSKFLELLLEIRRDMAEEAAHDVDEFVQNLRDQVGTPIAKNRADAGGPGNVRLNGSEIRKAEADSHKY
jgi:hypothetical protein